MRICRREAIKGQLLVECSNSAIASIARPLKVSAKSTRAFALAAGVLTLCSPVPAFAAEQEAPARPVFEPGRPADAPNPKPDSTATSKPGEIIVTGSRIARRDYKSDSPISTLDSSAISAAGQPSLDRVVGQMPQFEAAQGAAEVGDVQGSVGFGGGASYSDLRGIGRNRSLVLMDGRRLMPSTPDGSIDLNTIPMGLIDSVEVITGGASAAYGSDAIAGVANFKLRHSFSGLEINVQHGASTHGDGQTNQVSAIVGGSFEDGRGHAMLDLEYADRAAVEGSARPFFRDPAVRFLGRPPEGFIYAGGYRNGGTAPSIAAVNSVLASYPGTTPYAGTGAYNGGIGVNTDGSIFTTVVPGSLGCAQNYKGVGSVVGDIISPSCTQAGVVLGNYFAVQVPLKKYNAFASADYELTDHLTAYAQFNFSDSTAKGPNQSRKHEDEQHHRTFRSGQQPVHTIEPCAAFADQFRIWRNGASQCNGWRFEVDVRMG